MAVKVGLVKVSEELVIESSGGRKGERFHAQLGTCMQQAAIGTAYMQYLGIQHICNKQLAIVDLLHM